AVGADLAADEVGHHLLVRRAEAEVAVVAVLQPQQLAAVLLPAAALDPQLRGNHRGHEDLLRARAVHLLAHDALEAPDGAEPEGQEGVDAARHLADHARTDEEAVSHDLGVRGVLTQRRREESAETGYGHAAGP